MTNYVVNNSIAETKYGKMFVDLNDSIGGYVYRTGVWSIHILNVIDRFSDNNFSAIDAGANIGYLTLAMAKNFKRVYSIEPQRDVFYRLDFNIKVNNIKNVKAFNKAIGEEKDSLFLNNDREYAAHINEYGQINYGGVRIDKNSKSGELVEVDTLDNLIDFDIPVRVIKYDVQNFEYEALNGSKNLIEKFNPYLIVEIEEDKNKTLDLVRSFNYKVFKLKGSFEQFDYFCIHEKSFNSSDSKIIESYIETGLISEEKNIFI